MSTIEGTSRNTTVTINISTENPVAEVDGKTFGSLAEALLAATPESTVHLLESVELDEPLAFDRDVDLDLGSNALDLGSTVTFSEGCNCRLLNGFIACGREAPGSIVVKDDSELALGEGLVSSLWLDNSIIMTDGGLVLDGGVIVAEGGCTAPVSGDWSSGVALLRGAIVSATGQPIHIGVGARGIRTGAPALFGLPGKPTLLGCYAAGSGNDDEEV